MIASEYFISREETILLRLTDAYSLHRIIYDLFPPRDPPVRENGSHKGFLYADKGSSWSGRKILILSEFPPRSPSYGSIESRIVPETFLQYDHYCFEVEVNPTTRNGASGKTIPLKDPHTIIQWFLRKASLYGFSVDEKSIQVEKIGVRRFSKKNHMVTQATATIKGFLTVTNRELFQQSFREGIGRARGFGFGLLQLIPFRRK